jgi:hypothetical protein
VAPRPTVAIAGGTTTFPVRRIFCVGRNYPSTREMGASACGRRRLFEACRCVVESGAAVPAAHV